jgi:hypothetical protein
MKVEIKFLRGTNQFGRPVLFGQLHTSEDDRLIFDGSLVQILQLINAKEYELTNAKETLETIVLVHGFAS